MTLSMVATKLLVPTERAGWVTRARLLARLEAGAARRLILVSAPAGFGKTTLVASWLRGTPGDRTVAWLSLDGSDSDAAVFWKGVAVAIHGATSGAASGPGALPPVPADFTVGALINQLAHIPGEVFLVLDDYHRADHTPLAEGMKYFIDHLPPNTHIVFTTRADPDLPLARWRALGELVEIRALDLRFTPDETATYLLGATNTLLTQEQIAVLEDRTEGWIAALQLAAISIEGRDDVASFIDAFAGSHRFVVDYLIEEVLTQQAPEVRDFLLQSSVLDRLSDQLCNTVLDRDDAEEMLRRLERNNLFVVALDDTREWYRYHQLFADVLRARLAHELPDLIPLLHERASRWFEEHDLADPAIRHAVAAGQADRAADLIEAAVPTVRRHRQEALAQSWLRDLPDHLVSGRPVLAVLSAGLALVAGDVDTVRMRLDDADRALAAAPVEGRARANPLGSLPATIAVYRASLAQADGDTVAASQFAQQALDVALPDDHLSRGAAAGFLGLAAWASGDINQALTTFGQAVESLAAAGNAIDAFSATVVLADLWRAAGQPSRARAVCTRALRDATSTGAVVGRAIAELHVALAELDLEAGDLAQARQHLATADGWNRRTGPTESLSRSFVVKALLARAEGDITGAELALDEAERFYRPGFLPDLRPIPSVRARLRVSAGDLIAASEWARQRNVSVEDPAQHLREYDHLTLVRLLLAEHRRRPQSGSLRAALELLARLEEAATAYDRGGSLLEIRVLRALTLDAQGRRPDAVEELTRAWSLAPEPDSARCLFTDEANLAALLAVALPVNPGDLRRHTSPPQERLSGRELEVLTFLDSELTGPDIARALFISTNTLRTHTKHIFAKLGVSNRRAAVLRGRERSLLLPSSD